NYHEPDCVYPTTIDRIFTIGVINIQVSTDNQTSLKEAGKYNVGIYGRDLAGRIMYVNVVSEITVPSFLERNGGNGDLAATFFRLLLNNIDLSGYPDMKWLCVCVTNNISV